MEEARRKWHEEFVTAATISKEAPKQPLFSLCRLTTEFSGLTEKTLFLVADKVFSSTQNHNKNCTAAPLFH